MDYLKWLLWSPVLLVGASIAFISQLLEKRVERTQEKVLGVLLEMESGVISDDLWGEFLSVPIKNKTLDGIREKVEVLWAYIDFQEKNPEGFYV